MRTRRPGATSELTAFGREVADRYGLGTVWDVRPAGQGAMGRIWRLRTTTDDVAVKQLFWTVAAETLDLASVREVAFAELARTAGVRAPRQRADRDGRFASSTSRGAVRVSDWVDGRAIGADDLTAARWAGWVLATLTTLDFPTTGEVDPWFTTAPTEERWSGLVAAAGAADVGWAAELSRALPDLSSLGSLVDGGRGPLRVAWCHTDIQAQNIMRRPDGTFELIDWDDAGPVVPVYALARLLTDWCLTPVDGAAPSIDHRRVAAVLTGYRAGGGVELPTELTHYAGLVAGTLNFLAWQVVLALGLDSEQGPPQPAGGPAHAQVRWLLGHPLRPDTLRSMAAAVRRWSPS